MEEELKAMFRVCVAKKKDGTRCNSPALKGGNFCFQHIGGSLREHTRARSVYHGPKLDFLYPGTRQAIQHNLYVVAQAMNDGELELAQANTYNRIFSACERNLRHFEIQWEKSYSDPELLEVPDESPDETPGKNSGDTPGKTPAPTRPTNAPSANPGDQPSRAEQDGSQDRELSSRPESAPSADEAERPAFSDANTDSAGAPFKRSLSGDHDPNPPETANSEPSPEPAHSTPRPDPDNPAPAHEPLVLTPEEVARFKELETRYINDPTLADRIRETYRDIFEQRRAARIARESSTIEPQTAPPPTKCTISNLSPE